MSTTFVQKGSNNGFNSIHATCSNLFIWSFFDEKTEGRLKVIAYVANAFIQKRKSLIIYENMDDQVSSLVQ